MPKPNIHSSVPTVAIIGYGRFGKILYQLLHDKVSVKVHDPHALDDNGDFAIKALSELGNFDAIIYAVPIESFEEVLESHLEFLSTDQLLIDVLSVKEYPQSIFAKYADQAGFRYLLTHPMFGPDSINSDDLKIVTCQGTSTDTEYQYWQSIFKKAGLETVELTPRQHDEFAANSQGVAHLIGRMLEQAKTAKTPIDTKGAESLNTLREQTCNDSWELFTSLQRRNQYTTGMRNRIGTAFESVSALLLPTHINPNFVTIGIQGGEGSFNELACNTYYQSLESDTPPLQINYLYTSENVLGSLQKGEIDLGVFAIQNSAGGLVDESFAACAKYKFNILRQISIPITHHLMKLPDVKIDKITTIMAHPQVLKQCQQTLMQSYGHLTQQSGTGDLIDTAQAAKALSQGHIGDTTAILGPRQLADLYALEIIATDLQDDTDNLTDFIIASRIGSNNS